MDEAETAWTKYTATHADDDVASVYAYPPVKGDNLFLEELAAAAADPSTRNIVVVTQTQDERWALRKEFPKGCVISGEREVPMHVFWTSDLSVDLAMCDDQPLHQFVTLEQADLQDADLLPVLNLEDPAMQQMFALPGQIVRVSYGFENGWEDFNYYKVASTRVPDDAIDNIRPAPLKR